MSLEQLRGEIDRIDHELIKLYEERMEVCAAIAEDKIANGKKVFDAAREKEKLQTVRSLASNDFNAIGVEELFEQIMSMSRKLQYQKMEQAGLSGRLPFIEVEDLDREHARVVFQGAAGSYSQEAMFRYFGENVNSFHVDTFRDAMSAIDEGAADYAVLPIENSTAGIVSEIYDLLSEYENYIVAEQVLPVEHCLIGVPGANLSDIRTVYAHPQALMQSAGYLGEYPSWQQIGMKNNAFAVQKIAGEQDPSQAAIAGAHAAKVYGMQILKQGINDSDTNSTRFIVVTNQKIFTKGADKISIRLELKHKAGALYHALSHFIYNDLNMTKIESRPMEDRDWEYSFFIDFEGNLANEAVRDALRGLREEAADLKVLGNYKRGV